MGGLGTLQDRSLGCSGSEGWLSDPLPGQQVAPLNFNSQGIYIIPWEPQEVCCPRAGGRGHAKEGSDRDCVPRGTSILQQAVSGSQTLGEMAPGFRCVASEQVCAQHQVLDGDGANSAGLSERRGLVDLPGHDGCILPYSYSSSVQEVPEICIQREGFSVQGPMFRAQHCSPSFHQGISSTEQDSAFGRIQDSPVLRRLVSAGQDARRGVESEKVFIGTSTGIRHHYKSRKVTFGPVSVFGVPGDSDRHYSFLGFSSQETNRQGIMSVQRILVLRTNACKILAKLTGVYVITGKVCPWCQVAHEEVSILPKESLEKRLSAQGCFSPSASKAERRSCLVARQRKVGEGSVSGPETARPLPIHRCIQEELGCYAGSDSFVRKVEREGVQGAYKQTGVKSNLLCTERIRESSNRKGYSGVCRQYHCSFICKETGRHQVMGSVPSSGGNVSMVGGTQHYSTSQVCPRKDQCGGRHPEQRGADHPHRMDFECTGLRETVETMGSSASRSVCHLSNKETSRVLFATSGSQCHGSGCFSPIMGKSGRLCLPSFCHYKTGDKQTQTVKELSDDSGGPLVASEGVVSGSSQPSGRGSEGPSSKERLASTTSKQSSSPRTPHSSSNRLETILRLGRAKSLSGEVTKRVFNSRSKSTNALYQLRWSQYVKWCRKNKLSALRPSVNSICKFFIYLWEEKKFAVGTIKGFRSVLQSVLRHVDFDVGTNQDISDVIRSFIVERPIIKKESIAWNVDIVLKYLCSERFEPLSSASLRDLTRKTMFLVALALAKRVSELQALSSDVGFSDQGATVSLSLGFRAKNDSKARALPRSFLIKSLQQLVGQEEERKLCPVRALSAYLQRTKNYDRKGRNLFLAPSNPSRSASKNGIAYLLKSVIKEAHEKADPESLKLYKVMIHEIRAVSTSLAFAHNLSIDSVIEAGQWRSNSVFASHYLKEVALRYDECCALGPIVVAGTVIN